MKYINKEDIIYLIQERLLEDSNQFNPDILNGLETKAIAFVTSYISGRYDCVKIFENPVMRHELLVQTISMMVAYWSVRRNAARKVPEDYQNIYSEAIKIMNNIQSGVQKLDGMPEITGNTGTTGSLMYGNSTDKDFFI